MLLEQTDLYNASRAFEALHHVVHGQGGDRGSRQCLHFHAGAGESPGRGCYPDPGKRVVQLDQDLDMAQGNGMAQRDELRRALGGHHPGQLGGRPQVALREVAGADGGDCIGRKLDEGARRRPAFGLGLGGDIDHLRR
jgi:hypothetical protein